MYGLYDGDFVGYKIASMDEIDAALREAVVAVDANVLLNLYRYRPQTSQDLIKTLKSLGDRLVVPHQALREFWRRRQRSQDSPGGATKAVSDALDKSGRSICDALNAWARAVGADDREVSSLVDRVDDFLSGLKGEVQVSQDASRQRGGDPISEQLEDDARRTGHPTSDYRGLGHLYCRGQPPIKDKQPPGYMDADKQGGDLPEGGAGDYLLWYEATRYAQKQRRDLLIVTNDQKPD